MKSYTASTISFSQTRIILLIVKRLFLCLYCWISVHFVCFVQVSNESTYQEVVRASCGKVTGVICEVAIAVYTFGTCIAFLIVIGDQLDLCKYIHTDTVNHPPATLFLSHFIRLVRQSVTSADIFFNLTAKNAICQSVTLHNCRSSLFCPLHLHGLCRHCSTFKWSLCLNKGRCLVVVVVVVLITLEGKKGCAIIDKGKEHQGWHAQLFLCVCVHHVTHSYISIYWGADSVEFLLLPVSGNRLWPSTSFGVCKWMNGVVVTFYYLLCWISSMCTVVYGPFPLWHSNPAHTLLPPQSFCNSCFLLQW